MIKACDFILCIYQKEKKCTLDSVTVNAYGMCNYCELPLLHDLERLKYQTLNKRESDEDN